MKDNMQNKSCVVNQYNKCTMINVHEEGAVRAAHSSHWYWKFVSPSLHIRLYKQDATASPELRSLKRTGN